MADTRMYMLTETSRFMMGYVIITGDDNAIIIDGGREEDVPMIKQYVGGRRIKAWFLTHPHLDHINAFMDVVRRDDAELDFDAVYYNFPPVEFIRAHEAHEAHTLEEFNEVLPRVVDRAHIVSRGDVIEVDDVRFDVLYSWKEEFGFTRNAVNDSSIVMKMTTPHTTVMFLGDLGPEGGDKLMEESRHLLRAEYCQMAHHGHMCVGPEVYMAIEPRVCMWNAPDWLYDEEPRFIKYRMYGQRMTRMWMERLGVTEHLVTKDGTQEVKL